MEDIKRGSGRTTRMILAAYAYVLKTRGAVNPPKVEIVAHSRAMVNFIENMLEHIIPTKYIDRFEIITHSQYLARGRGKREFTFIDHHVHYLQLVKANNDVLQLETQLNAAKRVVDDLIGKMDEY